MMTLSPAQMTDRIARNLKLAREQAGLSQRDVAARLDPPVRQNEIRRWEHAIVRPREITRLQLAGIYGVDPGYLYAEHDEDPQ